MSVLVGIGVQIARRNVDGAKATGEAASPGAWRVDVAGVGSVRKLGSGVAALPLMRPEAKNVVVAVEYGIAYPSS